MTFYEQMVPALSILLEIGETLKAPIYGTLLQKKRNYTFGYLGLSESALLVSLLQGDSKKLKGSSRIPFSNIQKTKVRKSLFPTAMRSIWNFRQKLLQKSAENFQLR